MSKNVLLIDVQAIKDRTGLHKSMDESLLVPEIKIAQDTELQPALGSNFMKRLQEGILAADLTSEEQTLLDDYVTDTLVWFTMAQLPVSSSFQLFTKGTLRTRGENAELPSMSEMLDLSDRYKNRGEFYRERLIRYLSLHSSDFPTYDDGSCGDNDISPTSSGYSVPCWLGDD